MAAAADNLSLARQYLKALESSASSDELAQFFSPGVVVEIFPSSVFPKGSRSNLDGIRAAAERGKKVMSAQTYEITNALASGAQVALEVLWTGTLRVAFQAIPAGGHMRAHFATFLHFQDGKIISQRNYDCYDPI